MILAFPSRSLIFFLFSALAAAACSSRATKSSPDAQPDANSATDASVVNPPDSVGLDASCESQEEASQSSRLTVSPPSIDLGIVQPGVATSRQTITVTATSDIADLSVVLLGNDLALDGTSTCGRTLTAGTSCLVVITFLSPTTGTKNDSIAIVADGQSTGVPVTAKVQAGPHLVSTPANASLLPGVPITLNIGNTGDTAVGPLTIVITGPNAADYAATPTGCDLIAPSHFCTIDVVFTRTDYTCSIDGASLVVTGPGPDFATVSAALYAGPMTTPNPLLLSPSSSDLGSPPVGATGPSATFTLAYSGPTCLPPTRGPFTVTLSNTEFVVTDETCSTSVLPLGGTCTLSIALRPTSVGAKSADLYVTEFFGVDAGLTVTGALLSGNGTAIVDAGPVEPVDSGVERGEAGNAT